MSASLVGSEMCIRDRKTPRSALCGVLRGLRKIQKGSGMSPRLRAEPGREARWLGLPAISATFPALPRNALARQPTRCTGPREAAVGW
eukprot:3960381-Alexandrium_andersonii.AAC.1